LKWNHRNAPCLLDKDWLVNDKRNLTSTGCGRNMNTYILNVKVSVSALALILIRYMLSIQGN